MSGEQDGHPEFDEHARGAEARSEEGIDGQIAEHLPALLAYVRLRAGHRLRARESSMDIVQSACREVLQKKGSFREYRDGGDFKRWLYATVERKIIDRARFHSREKRSPDREVPSLAEASHAEVEHLARGLAGVLTPSRAAAAREELGRVEAAFRELPTNYREVILQLRILGRSTEDVAREMDCSPGAVRVLLHRALAKLAISSGVEQD